MPNYLIQIFHTLVYICTGANESLSNPENKLNLKLLILRNRPRVELPATTTTGNTFKSRK